MTYGFLIQLVFCKKKNKLGGLLVLKKNMRRGTDVCCTSKVQFEYLITKKQQALTFFAILFFQPMEVLVDIMPEGMEVMLLMVIMMTVLVEGVVVDIFLVVGEVVLQILVAHVVKAVLEELHQLV